MNRIGIVLKEEGVSQRELAQAMEVNPVNVSRWVNNLSQPAFPVLMKISTLLGVPLKRLTYSEEGVLRIDLAKGNTIDLKRTGFDDIVLKSAVCNAAKDYEDLHFTIKVERRADGRFDGYIINTLAHDSPMRKSKQVILFEDEINVPIYDCEHTKLSFEDVPLKNAKIELVYLHG